MTSRIHQEIAIRSKSSQLQQALQHNSQLMYYNVRSRVSLLDSSSFLRNNGIYGSLINESRKEDSDWQTTICLGACLSSWLTFLKISLAFIVIAKSFKDGWSIDWGFRVQYRVPVTSPLMRACHDGDVSRIRQILNDGRGGINDRSICRGKTCLLVSALYCKMGAYTYTSRLLSRESILKR
jgi:hypothetical protein